MKTALITGATGGIGGKTAEVLGQAGYEVIVTGIDEAGRDTVMSNLESKGIKAHFYKCDATSEEQVNETFAKIAEKFDHLDLLVNNVGGLGGRQRVSEMETGFMRKVMALNFDSLFFNTRAALPLLKKGTNPSIINFSTIAVTNGGGIGASIYAASKGAVQSYSRALAKDLAEFGIRGEHGFPRHHRYSLPRCHRPQAGGELERQHPDEAPGRAPGGGRRHRVPGFGQGILPHRRSDPDQRRTGLYLEKYNKGGVLVNLYTKMKKAAGAVLAVAMGMTCIPTPLAVYAQEPEEYTVILDENFESELSAGVKLSGGVSVVEMDGNHVLEFNDTSDSETSKANIEIGKQAGEIVVEYKLYVVSDEGKSTIALTAGSKEESGSSSTSSAGEFLRFKTTGSDSRTYEFRGGDSRKNSL